MTETLIESQQANIETLSEMNINQARTIAEQQKRIDEQRKEYVILEQKYFGIQAQVKALEKQLRIAKCCENIDCDRDDCPLAALQENE